MFKVSISDNLRLLLMSGMLSDDKNADAAESINLVDTGVGVSAVTWVIFELVRGMKIHKIIANKITPPVARIAVCNFVTFFIRLRILLNNVARFIEIPFLLVFIF